MVRREEKKIFAFIEVMVCLCLIFNTSVNVFFYFLSFRKNRAQGFLSDIVFSKILML